jgi:hypothetical protein
MRAFAIVVVVAAWAAPVEGKSLQIRLLQRRTPSDRRTMVSPGATIAIVVSAPILIATDR